MEIKIFEDENYFQIISKLFPNYFQIKILIFVLFFSSIFYNCKKDINQTDFSNSEATSSLTLIESKKWFDKNNLVKDANRELTEDNLSILSLSPNWLTAEYVLYKNIQKCVAVSVREDLSSIFPNSIYRLFFNKDSLGKVDCKLMVFRATLAYHNSHQQKYSVDDYTGLLYDIDVNGVICNHQICLNGWITNRRLLDFDFPSANKDKNTGCDTGCDHEPENHSEWINFLNNWDTYINNNNPSGGGGNNSGNGSNSGNNNNGSNGSGSGGGGGSSNISWEKLKDLFDDKIFENQQLNQNNCGIIGSNDEKPAVFLIKSGEHFLASMNYFFKEKLNGSTISFSDALATNINITSYKYNPIPYDVNTLPLILEIIDEVMNQYLYCKDKANVSGAGTVDPAMCECLKGYNAQKAFDKFLPKYLVQKLKLNPKLENLITINKTLQEKAILFLMSKPNKYQAEPYLKMILDYMADDPAYKFERFDELYNLLISDPEILIKDCVGAGSFWQDLVNFSPPSNVQERIKSLGKGWKLQDLMNPNNGVRLNLDYYAVKITKMPYKNNGTPEQWQPEEFFQYFRKYINNFFTNPNSTFNPYSPTDNSLWQSNNPLKTVLTIDIKPLLGSSYFGDDGSVICSQAESCCWIFSTLEASGWPLSQDGNHPVSGNRQFGYTVIDGVMTIYIKGVDRFYKPVSFNWFYPPEPQDFWWNDISNMVSYFIAEPLAFEGGNQLWSAFQQGMKTWITSHQGLASVEKPIIERPALGNLVLLLKGTTKITKVPCGE